MPTRCHTLYSVSSQMDVLKHVTGTVPERDSIMADRPANTYTMTCAPDKQRMTPNRVTGTHVPVTKKPWNGCRHVTEQGRNWGR